MDPTMKAMNTEAQLRAVSDGFYRSVFERSAVPTVIFSKDGKLLMANNAMDQLYGAPLMQVSTKASIEDLFHQRQRKRVIDHYRQIAGKQIKSSQFIFKDHHDQEHVVELRTRLLDEGDLLQATVIDLTEYKFYERQFQELANQASMINEIVAAFNSNLNKNQLIRIFFNQIGKVFCYDLVCLVLCDIEGKELEIHIAKDTTEISSQKVLGHFYRSFTAALSSCHHIEQKRSAIYQVIAALGLPIDRQCRSQMLIQLKSDEQLIGAIILFGFTENALTQHHFNIFQKLSEQIANAFMKARLLHWFQQSLTNLSFLSKINELLSSSFDLDSVLKQVVEASYQMVQAKICTIHFLETENHVTDGLAGRFEDRFIDQFKPQIQQVIINHKPLVVESIDYNSIQFFKNRADIQSLDLKSLVILPVIADGKAIALLSVFLDKVHYFREHEIEFLAMLADQAAIAIRNAGLYRQLERTKNFLESIIHSSVHIIVATDLEGMVTFFNKAACQLTGYSTDEVLSQPFFEQFIKNGRAIFNGLKHELISKKSLQSFDCDILVKNQRHVPTSWMFSPLFNQRDEIIGTLGIGRIISRQKRPRKHITLSI